MTRALFSPEPQWQILSANVVRNAKCVVCGGSVDLVAHHKLPRIFGGKDHRDNLEPVCRKCHPRREADAKFRARLLGYKQLATAAPRRRRVRIKRAGTLARERRRRLALLEPPSTSDTLDSAPGSVLLGAIERAVRSHDTGK